MFSEFVTDIVAFVDSPERRIWLSRSPEARNDTGSQMGTDSFVVGQLGLQGIEQTLEKAGAEKKREIAKATARKKKGKAGPFFP